MNHPIRVWKAIESASYSLKSRPLREVAEMNSHDLRERNRQTVARYFEEFWTKGNVNVVDELCSDDFALFYPLHGRHEGKEAIKRMLSDYKKVSHLHSYQRNTLSPTQKSLYLANTYIVLGLPRHFISTLFSISPDCRKRICGSEMDWRRETYGRSMF